jgi:tetratricopeptide (TPR) repeat protein
MLRFICAAISIVAVLGSLAAPVWADDSPGPHDYYDSDPGTRQLLRNVEAFHINSGMENMKKGSYGYAEKDFDFILKYFPNHPKGLLLMGDLALKVKNPEKAEPYFKNAIQMFPNRPSGYAAYGVFLQKQRHLDRAIENYQAALKLDPGSPSTNYNIGLAYVEKGQYERASVHAHKAYNAGIRFPALREKLIKAGAWKSTGESSPKE